MTKKPVDGFYSAPSRGDGRDSYCKQCRSAYKRKWEHDNHEKYRQRRKQYRKRVGECDRARNCRAKVEVLTYYGNGKLACIQCGETNINCLSIDHIDGGGAEHRRRISGSGGVRFYKWLKARDYPKGYQTLCMNCQWDKEIKRRENYGRE